MPALIIVGCNLQFINNKHYTKKYVYIVTKILLNEKMKSKMLPFYIQLFERNNLLLFSLDGI